MGTRASRRIVVIQTTEKDTEHSRASSNSSAYTHIHTNNNQHSFSDTPQNFQLRTHEPQAERYATIRQLSPKPATLRSKTQKTFNY